MENNSNEVRIKKLIEQALDEFKFQYEMQDGAFVLFLNNGDLDTLLTIYVAYPVMAISNRIVFEIKNVDEYSNAVFACNACNRISLFGKFVVDETGNIDYYYRTSFANSIIGLEDIKEYILHSIIICEAANDLIADYVSNNDNIDEFENKLKDALNKMLK